MKRPSYVLQRSILALRDAVAERLQDLLSTLAVPKIATCHRHVIGIEWALNGHLVGINRI